MGQRAALLLSELLLLLLTASRTLLAVSFPEDTVPLDVVDAHCEYTHAHMNSAATGGGWREITVTATSLKKITAILNAHFVVTPVTCEMKADTGQWLFLAVSAVQTLACRSHGNKINQL